MCVVVVGQVEYEKLKELIDNIEYNTDDSFERPWMNVEIPKFNNKSEVLIIYNRHLNFLQKKKIHVKFV